MECGFRVLLAGDGRSEEHAFGHGNLKCSGRWARPADGESASGGQRFVERAWIPHPYTGNRFLFPCVCGYFIGRSGVRLATGLVDEPSPCGQMRIANAGRLPPYRNGNEMNLEGSLPPGLAGEGGRPFVLKERIWRRSCSGSTASERSAASTRRQLVEHMRGFGQEGNVTVLGVQFAAG